MPTNDPRVARRYGIDSWARMKAAVRLTLSAAFQDSRLVSATEPVNIAPALATAASSRPNRSTTLPTRSRTASGSVTSAGIGTMRDE